MNRQPDIRLNTAHLQSLRSNRRVCINPWILSSSLFGLLFGLMEVMSPPPSMAQGLGTKEQEKAFQVAQSVPNPVIDVGVIQRFGDEATDVLTLEAIAGKQLKVDFVTGGQEQSVSASKVTIEVEMNPLPEPDVVERVVLSNHRSFESAEDSAKYWRSKGIEVEIAQPQSWQVWAKRDIYHSPLLRRLLLHNLQANGAKAAFIDTQTQRSRPRVSFTANGFRYFRDRFEISSDNDRIRVDSNEHETRLYGGEMRFQTNAYGTYTLVNEVPIETYLRGVVPHEIGLAAPRTAIEAQAVLARTYALRNLRRFEIDGYELCADTQCQVYWGLGGAADVSDRAIAATRGKVLTYNNELVDALYSSTTGGITSPFSHVWNGPDRPYLRAVVDSVQNLWDLSSRPLSNEENFQAFMNLDAGFNEEGWDAFRWRREGTLESLTADMKNYLSVIQHPLAHIQSVEKLEVTQRAESGRVQTLEVTTDLGVIELTKDEVIRALYPPRSTLFYLEPLYEEVTPAPVPVIEESAADSTVATVGEEAAQPSPLEAATPAAPVQVLKGYAFVGGGFGHGVGMSQTGAYNLGKLGWSSDRILSFYYPGSTLQVLNDDIVFWQDPEADPAEAEIVTLKSHNSSAASPEREQG
ncbi:MAG: SpoIID/LytB domain-containing protein [Leptolyngbyaceae bacterium]|nr:SpoIID/LytB domain-containing protein [Leptolyngbyaceae bacterium]